MVWSGAAVIVGVLMMAAALAMFVTMLRWSGGTDRHHHWAIAIVSAVALYSFGFATLLYGLAAHRGMVAA